MLGHALAITWPIWFALKWKKSPPHYIEITELWPILHSIFLTLSLLHAAGDGGRGFFSSPGFQVILTFDICNNKKKKEVYNCVVQMKVEGEKKFNVLLYKSHDGCLRWKKSNVSQFVNFGTRWPLEIQQYREFTSKSSTCKWPGTVSPLD